MFQASHCSPSVPINPNMCSIVNNYGEFNNCFVSSASVHVTFIPSVYIETAIVFGYVHSQFEHIQSVICELDIMSTCLHKQYYLTLYTSFYDKLYCDFIDSPIHL